MIVTTRNMKGGVGKTTLSMNLLAAAQPGACLIDVEEEECAQWRQRGRRFSKSSFTNSRMAEADSEEKLHRLLSEAQRRRWSIIINTPGERATPLIREAVKASTLVLIPLTGDQVELPRTLKTIEEVQQSGTDFLLVLNKVMPRVAGRDARSTAGIREMLQPYRKHLWSGQITRTLLFNRAAIAGVSVFDFTNPPPAAAEVSELWRALVQRARTSQN